MYDSYMQKSTPEGLLNIYIRPSAMALSYILLSAKTEKYTLMSITTKTYVLGNEKISICLQGNVHGDSRLGIQAFFVHTDGKLRTSSFRCTHVTIINRISRHFFYAGVHSFATTQNYTNLFSWSAWDYT